MTWLSTHLQAAVAAQQCHRLCGVSTVASPGGTLAWSRNSAATVRVDVPSGGVRCCVVAPNMPRTALIGTTKGMVCEPEEKNWCFVQPSGWTAVNTISQATCDGPDGLPASATRISAKNAVTGGSGFYKDYTITGSQSISPSIWVRIPTGSTGYTWNMYDVSSAGAWRVLGGGMITGVWYKIDSAAPAGILTKDSGWTSRSGGTSAIIFTCSNCPADGPGNIDVAFASSIIAPTSQVSSTIIATTAAVTRLADSAVYTLSTEIDTKQGMAKVSYDKGPVSGGAITALDISDGGSSADHVAIGIDASDHATAASAMTGGDAGATAGTTDVRDGAAHAIQATWLDDALTVYADGTAEGTPDTACDMPENLDTITIGPARQLITSIKVWTTNLAKAM